MAVAHKGGTRMNIPSYLRVTKHNIYVFRRRIPKDLQNCFKTNEIRISLGIKDKKQAITKSYYLALEYEKLFNSLRIGMQKNKSNQLSGELAKLVENAKVVTQKNIQLEEAREIENALRMQIFQERKIHNLQLKELVAPEGRKILLSEMIKMYFDENELLRRGDSPATVRKDKEALNLFFKLIGDKFVSDISQQNAAEFAREIPSYENKRTKLRAPATSNKYLNSISKFSGWITAFHSDTRHSKLDFSRFKYKTKIKHSESRDAFSDDEVARILSSSEFIKLKESDPSVYWLINISAYSGARLEEIAQLNPFSDFYLKDSVWVIDINNLDNKSLKNLSSKRLVPIHSKLLQDGLLQFVETTKDEKLDALLGREKPRDGRIGKNAGKRVKSFIQNKIGISGKSLHSFRHTFVTKLKRLEVAENLTAAIVGHEAGGITYSSYGKNYLASQLQPIVELISFDL